MTGWTALGRFLNTDPRDVGCEHAMALLHIYVELGLADPANAAEQYPGVLVHLEASGGLLRGLSRAACRDFVHGLTATSSPVDIEPRSLRLPGVRPGRRRPPLSPRPAPELAPFSAAGTW